MGEFDRLVWGIVWERNLDVKIIYHITIFDIVSNGCPMFYRCLAYFDIDHELCFALEFSWAYSFH